MVHVPRRPQHTQEVCIRAEDGACGRLEAAQGHTGERASRTLSVANRMSKISISDFDVDANEGHLDEEEVTAGLRVQKQGVYP